MLLRVIHPNVDSICNVTGLLAEDVLDIVQTQPAKVLIYVPYKWAFVTEELMDAHISSLIDIMES